MPRYVHIIPLHNSDSRHKGHYGADEGYYRGVNAVEAVRSPEKEDTYEDGNGLVLLDCHLPHCIQLGLEPLHPTLNLGLPLLRLHREYYLCADKPSYEYHNDGERETGHEPFTVPYSGAVCAHKQ